MIYDISHKLNLFSKCAIASVIEKSWQLQIRFLINGQF